MKDKKETFIIGIWFDPNGKYADQPADIIIGGIGVLGHWVSTCPIGDDLVEYLTSSYGCGKLYKTKDYTISANGIFSYPGDPNLHPYCKIVRKHETAYIYPHAIVAIVYNVFI